MGINVESLDFILKTIRDNNIALNKCRMIELGNQLLRPSYKPAKLHFQSLGVDHVSVDLNGKNGALKLDLQQEINDISLINTFDILTNFGTTEHIKQQYTCWLNIHNLVKQRGIFIHTVPRVGHWRKHGYHKYNLEFFQRLADNCGYKLIENFIRKGDSKKDLISCSMIKKEENKFISSSIFNGLFNFLEERG